LGSGPCELKTHPALASAIPVMTASNSSRLMPCLPAADRVPQTSAPRRVAPVFSRYSRSIRFLRSYRQYRYGT
jgi:hypothetical protein